MTTRRSVRNWIRVRVIGLVRPMVPEWLLHRMRHSVDRPFGDRYYQERARQYEADRERQPSWSAEYSALQGLASGLGRGLSVLDVPIGTGRFIPIYQESDWKVCGLDISEDMLAVARTKGEGLLGERLELRRGSAKSLPFADQIFDVVVCFRFLQAIVSFRDAQVILAEFTRVTKSFLILHIDVSSGAALTKPESLRRNETMRGKFGWTEVEGWFSDNNLEILEKLKLSPSPDDTGFVVLLSKQSHLA